MADEEAKEQQWLNEHGDALPRQVVTIPVVVHIVYQYEVQNLSVDQIQSQIDVLNQCYRKLNTDWTLTPAVWAPLVADCEFELCLASRDPNGNPTDGITRTETSTSAFSLDDQVKFTSEGGEDAWPANQYLNIWVCNLASGYLGYAQLPTLLLSYPETDGVVISNKAFGTTGLLYPQYHEGKTAVHEIGHWLGLFHIWGDDGDTDNNNNNTTSFCSGSDNISDTPNSSEATFGCPAFPVVDGCTTSNGKMFMNFMDYSDDACLYMFTNGQKTKMVSVINSTRTSIKSSQGCLSVGIFEPSSNESLQIVPNPTFGSVNITLPSSAVNFANMQVFNSIGQVVQNIAGGGYNSSGVKIDLSGDAEGIYIIRVVAGEKVYVGKVMLEK